MYIWIDGKAEVTAVNLWDHTDSDHAYVHHNKNLKNTSLLLVLLRCSLIHTFSSVSFHAFECFVCV